MTGKLDWAATIEPGRTMLGLTLGLELRAVRKLLGSEGELSRETTTFPNSPRLAVDDSKDGVILLRAEDMGNVAYAWQDVLVRLIFTQGVLTSIVALGGRDTEAYAYRGKILDKVGLGSPVMDLLEFGSLEYDDVEEVFLSGALKGLEVGGSSACDLLADSSQVVTFVRIF